MTMNPEHEGHSERQAAARFENPAYFGKSKPERIDMLKGVQGNHVIVTCGLAWNGVAFCK